LSFKIFLYPVEATAFFKTLTNDAAVSKSCKNGTKAKKRNQQMKKQRMNAFLFKDRSRLQAIYWCS
jgi:hypothetical protein